MFSSLRTSLIILAVITSAFGIEPDSHWPLDGDFSETGQNPATARPFGNASFGEGANGRQALLLHNTDGSQGFAIRSLELRADESFTLTAWIKPWEIHGGFSMTTPHTIARFWSESDQKSGLDFRLRDAKLDVFATTPSSKNLSSQLEVAAGRWNFVAIVCTPSEITVHVYPRHETFSWAKAHDFDSLFIGSNAQGSTRGLNGAMADVSFFRSALSNEDLGRIYAQQKPANP